MSKLQFRVIGALLLAVSLMMTAANRVNREAVQVVFTVVSEDEYEQLWQAQQQLRMNLNTATLLDLCTLPGIGEQKAEAILVYRAEQGGFTSAEQLAGVPGIGAATLERLRAYITVAEESEAPNHSEKDTQS